MRAVVVLRYAVLPIARLVFQCEPHVMAAATTDLALE